MIIRAVRTLAIFSLAITVSCSGQITPATPSTADPVLLRVYSTDANAALLAQLTRTYSSTHPLVGFDTLAGNHDWLLQRVMQEEVPYFLSSYLPLQQALWAAPIAQDGLALVVNPDTGLSNLTLEDVRRIYRGHVLNWRELGGADLAVVLFSREDGSDTRLEFERLVMGRERTSPNAQILPSIDAMIDRIATVPGAIGYVPVSQLSNRVQAIMLEGVVPSVASVAANQYPLRSTIYMIGRQEPEGEMRAFVGWAQGAEGQQSLGAFTPLPR